MYRKLIQTILILFAGINLFGQDTINYKTVDEETYNQYISGEWKKLINTGKEALDHNIDYYYLRLRMGIAYYSKRNYAKSVQHFEKAFESNSSDTLLNEYLYYAYLFSGYQDRLVNLEMNLSNKMRTKLKVHDTFIKSVYFEGGSTYNDDYKNLQKKNIYNDYVVNDQLFPQYSIYGNLALTHTLNKKIKITHAYTYLNIKKMQRIAEIDRTLRQSIHYTHQNQYYLGLRIPLGNDFSFKAAANILWVDTYYNLTDITYIEPYIIPEYTNFNYKATESVKYFAINKRFLMLDAGLFVSFSDLNALKQRQVGLQFTYMPLGNNNLYFTSNVLNFRNGSVRGMVLDQTVGFGLKRVWLEIVGTFGKDLANYSEGNAYLVYNGTDLIKDKYSGSLIYPVSSHLEVMLRYNYIRYKSWVDQYDTDGNITWSYYNYLTHTFVFGLKLKV